MNIEVVEFCPINQNNICESIVDGKIKRCKWYQTVPGVDIQTGLPINESRCSPTWMPTLSVENSQINRSQMITLESLRNAVVLRKLENAN